MAPEKTPYPGRDWDQDMLALLDGYIEHIELENRSYLPGSWGNNAKRPFGNSSCWAVCKDIAEIISMSLDLTEEDYDTPPEEHPGAAYTLNLYAHIGPELKRRWAAFRKST